MLKRLAWTGYSTVSSAEAMTEPPSCQFDQMHTLCGLASGSLPSPDYSRD